MLPAIHPVLAVRKEEPRFTWVHKIRFTYLANLYDGDIDNAIGGRLLMKQHLSAGDISPLMPSSMNIHSLIDKVN